MQVSCSELNLPGMKMFYRMLLISQPLYKQCETCVKHVTHFRVDKKRDKLERKVLDSQERAFWDVHRTAVSENSPNSPDSRDVDPHINAIEHWLICNINTI